MAEASAGRRFIHNRVHRAQRDVPGHTPPAPGVRRTSINLQSPPVSPTPHGFEIRVGDKFAVTPVCFAKTITPQRKPVTRRTFQRQSRHLAIGHYHFTNRILPLEMIVANHSILFCPHKAINICTRMSLHHRIHRIRIPIVSIFHAGHYFNIGIYTTWDNLIMKFFR